MTDPIVRASSIAESLFSLFRNRNRHNGNGNGNGSSNETETATAVAEAPVEKTPAPPAEARSRPRKKSAQKKKTLCRGKRAGRRSRVTEDAAAAAVTTAAAAQEAVERTADEAVIAVAQEAVEKAVSAVAEADDAPLAVELPLKTKPKPKRRSVRKPTPTPAIPLEHREARSRVILPSAAIDLLSKVSSSIAAKSAKPALQHGLLKVSADGKFIDFAVTDLQHTLRVSAEIPEALRYRVPRGDERPMLIPTTGLRAMARIKCVAVDLCDNGEGEIRAFALNSGGRVVSAQRFPADDPDDFPTLPVFDPIEEDYHDCDNLLGAILEAQFACATEGGRYAMHGVCLALKGGRVVATDGKRLHLIPYEFAEPLRFLGNKVVAVPPKLGRLWQPEKSRITFPDDGRTVAMIFPEQVHKGFPYHLSWISLLVDGEFPPFEDVLPHVSDSDLKWRIDESSRKDIVDGLKTIMGQCNGRESLATVISFKNGDEVQFGARDPNTGDITFTLLGADFTGGEPMELAFNPSLMLDIFKNPRLRTVHLRDAKSPALFEGTDLFHVIMPIQLV